MGIADVQWGGGTRSRGSLTMIKASKLSFDYPACSVENRPHQHCRSLWLQRKQESQKRQKIKTTKNKDLSRWMLRFYVLHYHHPPIGFLALARWARVTSFSHVSHLRAKASSSPRLSKLVLSLYVSLQKEAALVLFRYGELPSWDDHVTASRSSSFSGSDKSTNQGQAAKYLNN